jgi:hypothetical protein
LPQRGKPVERFQKDILDEGINIALWDLSEQNAVNHAGVALVEAPECRPVPVPRRAHQHRIVGDFGRSAFTHGTTSQGRHEQVRSIFRTRRHAGKIPTTK